MKKSFRLKISIKLGSFSFCPLFLSTSYATTTLVSRPHWSIFFPTVHPEQSLFLTQLLSNEHRVTWFWLILGIHSSISHFISWRKSSSFLRIPWKYQHRRAETCTVWRSKLCSWCSPWHFWRYLFWWCWDVWIWWWFCFCLRCLTCRVGSICWVESLLYCKDVCLKCTIYPSIFCKIHVVLRIHTSFRFIYVWWFCRVRLE